MSNNNDIMDIKLNEAQKEKLMESFRQPPADILRGALLANLQRVFILGYLPNGQIYTIGSHESPIHISDIGDFMSRVRTI